MPRSNRQLTQFAVAKVEQFLKSPQTFVNSEQGNTSVQLVDCSIKECPLRTLQVRLFGEVIFTLVLSEGSVCCFLLSSGDFYDAKGRPSRTTRERLNGLLDAMSTCNLLPDGVRAFINRETEECCIGIGDGHRTLGRENSQVMIMANPNRLLFL